MLRTLTTIFILLFSLYSHAQWTDSINQAWEKTKETSQELLENGSSMTKQVIDDYFPAQSNTPARTKAQRLQEIWQPLLKKLDQGITTRRKIETAPSFALWGEDKDAVMEDYQELMSEVIVILQDPILENNRNHIQVLKKKIETLNTEVFALKEQRIIAPVEHKFETSKSDIDKKISSKKAQIRDYQNEISKLIKSFQVSLQEMGINLSSEQIEILLVRVDADNIMQMLTVLDILKDITQQLSQLLNDSQEDLLQARRYYGMHLILLEMVAHMQHHYLEHIDNIYIPKLDGIRNKTLMIQQNSKQGLNEDYSPSRIKVYRQNIKAQELTLKIIEIYVKQLEQQKTKIDAAQSKLKKDIELAQNTYNTVMISAELSHLLQSSIEAFNALQQIQIPDIIPFENIQMQKKYVELSRAIEN